MIGRRKSFALFFLGMAIMVPVFAYGATLMPLTDGKLAFTTRNIVAIGVGNKNEIGRSAEKDPAVSDRDTGSEGDFVVEELLGVEDTVAVGVFKNLNATELFVFVGAPVDVVVVEVESPSDIASASSLEHRHVNYLGP